MTRRKALTDEAVGDKIRAARLKAGLTQTQLGEKVGLKVQSIYNYEKGKNRATLVLLHKIAAALKISVTDLM